MGAPQLNELMNQIPLKTIAKFDDFREGSYVSLKILRVEDIINTKNYLLSGEVSLAL